MKRVYRAASLIQVAHARNVLITAGIRCELRNQYLAGGMGELPMMETWPQLFVDDADERYALSVLARASSAQAGSPWICDECQEQLEPQFTTCWRCGFERGRGPSAEARLRQCHQLRRRIGWRVHSVCQHRHCSPHDLRSARVRRRNSLKYQWLNHRVRQTPTDFA